MSSGPAVCGTDVEFFTGHMAYLRTGEARYPVRIGHEWCGVVARSGDEATAAWVGQRVIGDTMLGCGRCLALSRRAAAFVRGAVRDRSRRRLARRPR